MAVSWLKKGADSAKLAQKEEAEAQKRKEEQGKAFRFWMKEDEEARITFVDGDLGSEGFLLPARYYEHNLKINGKWNNFFVCPEKTHPDSGEKCPICEGGDRPSLVALFTIIDHRAFKSKDGQKTYSDTAKILAAKPATFELLNKIAVKRHGLAGATFDVSRIGDKAAAVGSMFDFLEKHNVEELKKNYVREFTVDGKKVTKSIFVPFDYEKEIVYRSETELRKMGFGKGGVMSSSQTSEEDKAAPPEFEEHL